MPPDKIETTLEFIVPDGYVEDERVDVYLTRLIRNGTRSKVQKGIRDGAVTVDGTVVLRVSHRVQAGNRIVCQMMAPPPIEAVPEAIPLDIVYEDDRLIVVNKPAGMVVHPAHGNRSGTLVNALLHHVGGQVVRRGAAPRGGSAGLSTVNAFSNSSEDSAVRPGIVHRLDKGTTGLLVVAKDDEAHAIIARQFAARTIRRHYVGIVWGVPLAESSTVDRPIGRDPRDRKRMATSDRPDARGARTHLDLLEAFQHTAVVKFRLETGRTHQIRVHSRHLGHPIVGDETYGGSRLVFGPDTRVRRAFFRNIFERLSRPALHAASLGFEHPGTGKDVYFEAAVPDDMTDVMGRLRHREPLPGSH
jgi:23S rRNA pseudouridine1911/1915/1917 synthase